MTRVTRAAMRSQASSDNSGVDATMSLSINTPTSRRMPLGEISGNQEEFPAAVEDSEAKVKANKGPGKGKKGKASKKSKKKNEAGAIQGSGDVLPDDNESEISSAVEDACQDLRKEQAQGLIVMHDQSPFSPPSPAVIMTTEELSQEPSQQSENPSVVVQSAQIDSVHNKTDQGPIALIEKGPTHPEEPKQVPNPTHVLPESGVEQDDRKSTSNGDRALSKAAMRPEDSIEAMDDLEDEIEKVGDLLPATKPSNQSPKKSGTIGKPTTVGKPRPVRNVSNAVKLAKSTGPRETSSKVKPKAAALLAKGAAVHPSVFAQSDSTKLDSQNRQVSDSSSASEKASNAAKKRVSSVHKAPFVPAKSTKPPTRSNFELPGEAFARKLREAREERMKRDEEEEPKKPAFKARPVRLSQAPIVKPTATSRARISMAKGEIQASSSIKDTTLKSKTTPRPSAVSAATAGKRLSTLSVNKRLAPTPANSSARVNRGPPVNSTKFKSVTTKPALQNVVRQSIGSSDAAQLRAKGKEVFNRGKMEQDERERMRKEKEEAAKKARAEAAERGRIASREWAEKQRARKMIKATGAETVTNGEATISPA